MASAFPPEDAVAAPPYVFAGSGAGECDRLGLLARLLDPLHQRALQAAGMRSGLRCLELGSGTGTISAWMADQVGADGQVTATDINLSFLKDLPRSNLTVRELDVLSGEMPSEAFDVITCRALLHHLPQWESVVHRLAGALAPNGVLVLIEPDAGAALFGEAKHQRFWSAWCRWGQSEGIDFRLGHKLPRAVRLAGLDLRDVSIEVPFYCEGSPWSDLYRSTVEAARPRLGPWLAPDLIAEFKGSSSVGGDPMCSFGWVTVCGQVTAHVKSVQPQ
ncbi:class I SAM-dependent methyltransferase [Streptomyces sp. NBC_00690]|uniref:class I SAM-dependent methyltransferase n=1 Tax=Streptomyces sp. NBC_00690 TaxID=2975808 RepID=UPI002E287258|nr:class I SAM-dependent methyltransferase [Streptomyces sp. NBC_00690]